MDKVAETSGASGVKRVNLELATVVLGMNLAIACVALPQVAGLLGVSVSVTHGVAKAAYLVGWALQIVLNVLVWRGLAVKGGARSKLGVLTLVNLGFLLVVIPDLFGEGDLFRVLGFVFIVALDLIVIAILAFFMQKTERIMVEGKTATARVIGFQSTDRGVVDPVHGGRTANIALRLRVEPDGEGAFDAVAKAKVYNPLPGETFQRGRGRRPFPGLDLRKLQPDMEVPVRYDPAKPDVVYIDEAKLVD